MHVTYILNAITGNIYIGNIDSGHFCCYLRFLLCQVYATIGMYGCVGMIEQ